MVLMKCKECGKEVSDRAHMCPHCGIEGDPDDAFGRRYTLGESTLRGREERWKKFRARTEAMRRRLVIDGGER